MRGKRTDSTRGVRCTPHASAAAVVAVGHDRVVTEFETPDGFGGDPGQFVKDLKEAVEDVGVDEAAAHIESFGPK